MNANVKQFQTDDDGEILIVDGEVAVTDDIDAMAYLCLFGGNDDDDGLTESSRNWWGNFDETDPLKQYRSETQFLMSRLPPVPANLLRLKEAASRDLSAIVQAGLADSIDVVATMPGLNRVSFVVTVNSDGIAKEFELSESWRMDP